MDKQAQINAILQKYGHNPSQPIQGGDLSAFNAKLDAVKSSNATIDEQKVTMKEKGLPVSVRKNRVEPTGLGNVVRGILKPFASVATTPVPAVRSVTEGSQSFDETYRPIKTSYLGDVYSPGAKGIIQLDKAENAGDVLEGTARATADITGKAGEIASYFVGAGELNAGRKALPAVLGATKTGAKIGTGGGLAVGLQDAAEAETLGEAAKAIVKDTAIGGLTGGVAGGLLSGTGKVLSNVKQGITNRGVRQIEKQSNFIDELITPKMTSKESAAAIKSGRVLESTGLTGERTFKDAINNFDNIKSAVNEVEGISSKNTNLENANLIRNKISELGDNLEQDLVNAETQIGNDRGFFTPNEFNKEMNLVKSRLSENPLIVGDAEKTATKLIEKFNSLVKQNGYKPSGLLKSRKELDIWVKAQKGDKVFDTATENAFTIALRDVRNTANEFLANKVPDVGVKDSLLKQSSLYNALDTVAEKASKEGGSKVKRFMTNNPKTTQALKYGGSAALGGTATGILLGN